MIEGTVYSFGSIQSVQSSLNAVAMIFNSPTFDGGSLIILAMMIALISFLIPAAISLKPNYTLFFGVFLLYFAGIQPKMDLNIEDYYSGEVAKVSNIPLIVGMPASLAASISYELGSLIEGVMSDPTTTKTFKQEGFSDPLKKMLSLREILTNKGSLNLHWQNSMEAFVKNCAVKSANWDYKKAKSAYKLSSYLLNKTALPVSGLTVYFSASSPLGRMETCDKVQDDLLSATNLSTTPTGIEPVFTAEQLSAMMAKGVSDNPIKLVPADGITTLEEAKNAVFHGSLTSGQTSQDFVTILAAMQPLEDGVKCGSTTIDYNACIADNLVINSMEQQRIDQAAGASVFAKTAVPLMNILMVLFFLFSPILLIVALMMPAKLMQIIGGYMMFAVWTQSWLPTAMVINYIINLQTADAVARIAPNGINQENVFAFYNTIATNVGLASELFAMTPMITMALLSGSVYGLQGLATSMNAKDKFNEKNLAPDLMETGAIASNSSIIASQTRIEASSSTGGIYTDLYTNGASATQQFGNIGVSYADVSGLSEKKLYSIQRSKALGDQRIKALSVGDLVMDSTTYQDILSSMDSFTRAQITKAGLMAYESLSEEDKKTVTNKEEFAGKVGIQIFGGSGIQYTKSEEVAAAKAVAHGKQTQIGEGNENSAALQHAVSQAYGVIKSSAFSTTAGKTKSKSLIQAEQEQKQAADEYAAEERRVRQTSMTTQERSDAVGANILAANGGSVDAAKINLTDGLKGKDKDLFEQMYNEKLQKAMIRTNGKISNSGKVGIMLEVLESLGGGHLTRELIENKYISSGENNIGIKDPSTDASLSVGLPKSKAVLDKQIKSNANAVKKARNAAAKSFAIPRGGLKAPAIMNYMKERGADESIEGQMLNSIQGDVLSEVLGHAATDEEIAKYDLAATALAAGDGGAMMKKIFGNKAASMIALTQSNKDFEQFSSRIQSGGSASFNHRIGSIMGASGAKFEAAQAKVKSAVTKESSDLALQEYQEKYGNKLLSSDAAGGAIAEKEGANAFASIRSAVGDKNRSAFDNAYKMVIQEYGLNESKMTDQQKASIALQIFSEIDANGNEFENYVVNQNLHERSEKYSLAHGNQSRPKDDGGVSQMAEPITSSVNRIVREVIRASKEVENVVPRAENVKGSPGADVENINKVTGFGAKELHNATVIQKLLGEQLVEHPGQERDLQMEAMKAAFETGYFDDDGSIKTTEILSNNVDLIALAAVGGAGKIFGPVAARAYQAAKDRAAKLRSITIGTPPKFKELYKQELDKEIKAVIEKLKKDAIGKRPEIK